MRPDDLYVIAAVPLLALAQGLIRFVPLHVWRATLGPVATLSSEKPGAEESSPSHPNDRRCARIARAVMRGDEALLVATKCLARAVATQWLSRLRGCRSVLVIAVGSDRDALDGDRFHAWVETADGIVIGHCDRASYHPVLRFGSVSGDA